LLLTGDLDAAGRSFQQLLALAQSRGETLSVTTYVNALGIIAHEQSRFEDAEVSYRRVVELAKPAGDRRSLALALCNISLVRRDQERYHDASLLAQKASRMLKELDQAELLSYIHIVESQLALDRGELTLHAEPPGGDATLALAAADAALTIAVRANAVREQVEANLCRGLALSRLHDGGQAASIDILTDGLAQAQTLQLKRVQLFGHECLAEALARRGDTRRGLFELGAGDHEAARLGFTRSSNRLARLRRRLQGLGI
jgi:tetratricopeptide (TPR) repeat protein